MREALETLEKVDTLVVDKTGTLTEGKPKLVTAGDPEVLRLAASVEQLSEHPLAAAIVAGAQERNLALSTAEEFRSLTGQGVTGVVDGHTSFDREPQLHRKSAPRCRKMARPWCYVSIDGQPAGSLGASRSDQGHRPRSHRDACIATGCAS